MASKAVQHGRDSQEPEATHGSSLGSSNPAGVLSTN